MTIRVIELFAGIGAQASALERIGLDHELVCVSEIDDRAYRAYCAIHGDVPNLGDITKIEHLPECDLLTYSFPCLGAGTLIQTTEGWKPIEDVKVGDKVWTDDGWRSVTKSMMTGIKRTYRIRPSSGLEIRATGNHPFLVRRMHREWNNERRSYDRLFSEPEWVAAEDITKDMYLGYKVPDEGDVPEYVGYQDTRTDGRVYTYDSLKEYMHDPRFWWTVGRYIADGFIRSTGCVVLCIGKGKEGDADNIPFHYTVSKGNTCSKYIIAKKELGKFLSEFGKGAYNKHIPMKYRNIPLPLAKAMLDGYLSGDGHYDAHIDSWRAATISPALALDISQLIAYVHHRPVGINVTHRKPTAIIEGRTVNQHDSINLKFHEGVRIQDKSFYEDGWIWTRILDIEGEGDEEPVYDLEVEDRHCFTANGVVVHNCTDISMAGQRLGMEEGSGTRSSLLWEVGRLLNDYHDRGCLPDVLLMENVDAILFKANMPGFERWMRILSDMGYTNSYQVLNAKDYGVPQNRKRCFLVSTLTKGKLVFPKPIPLTKRLKDVLEPSVAESFYLSEERIATFERHKARNVAKGNGFFYKPMDPDGDSERERVAASITTNADRYCSNWIDETPKLDGQGEPGIDVAGRIENGSTQNGVIYDTDGISPAPMASAGEKGNHVRIAEEPKAKVVGEHNIPTRFKCVQQVYDRDGLSPTICAGDGRTQNMPKIEEPQIQFAGKLNSGSRFNQAIQVLDSEGIAPALTTTPPGIGLPKVEEPSIKMAGHLTDTPFEQAQRVYDTEGLDPAMKARDFKEPTKIEEPSIEITGNLNIPGRYESAQRVYGQEGIAPALNTASGGGLVPKIEIVGDLHLEKQGKGRNNHANDVMGVDGISTCLTAAMGEGGGHVPKIECTPIVTTVRKRAHDVDQDALVSLLRDSKKNKGLSNKEIASEMGKPTMEVEHWFRTDDGWSIPDPDCWMRLKTILGITTDEFDAPVCEFIQEDNRYESAGRMYDPDGIAPTITAVGGIKISEEPTERGGNR